MKSFQIIWFLIPLYSIGLSQSLSDSLIFSDSTKSTEEKISKVFEFCESNLDKNPGQVYQILSKSRNRMPEKISEKATAKFDYYLAQYFYNVELIDSAYFYFNQSDSLKTFLTQKQVFNTLLNLSVISSVKGELKISTEFLAKAGKYIENSSNDTFKGLVFQQMAYLKMLDSNYPEASTLYQNALNKFRSTNDTLNTGLVFTKIAELYSIMGNYPLATDYLEKAEHLFQKTDNKKYLGRCLLQKGKTQMMAAKYNDAFTSLTKAENLLISVNDSLNLATTYIKLAKTSELLKNFNECALYLNNAVTIAQALKSSELEAEVYAGFGDMYASTGNLYKAVRYYNRCLSTFNGSDNKNLRCDIYLKLSNNYSLLKKFDNAYKFQVLYNAVDRSILMEKNSEYTARMDKQLDDVIKNAENEKKVLQTELSLLGESKHKKETITKLLILGLFMSVLVLIYLVFRIRNKNLLRVKELTEKINDQKIRLKKSQNDYEKFKKTSDRILNITTNNMWEPFLVLDKLSEEIQIQDNTKQNYSLESFSENDQLIMARNLLENVLYWAKNQLGLLDFHPQNYMGEEIIKPIVAIQMLRARAKNIEIELKPNSQALIYADKTLLQVALRNIIENALKFSTENGKVIIEIHDNNKITEIIVKDNGVGMTREQINMLFVKEKPYFASGTHGEKGAGIGLALTKVFIERNFGNLHIESSIARGTIVKVSLPSISGYS